MTNVELARKYLGHSGRMISGSKGQYNHDNPRNVTVFNGNLVLESGEKIWYGDLDLTVDEPAVVLLATALGERVYVLREMDARFENESNPKIQRAVYSTNGESAQFDKELYVYENNKLVDAPEPAPTEEELEAKAERVRKSYDEREFEVVNLKLPFDDLTEEDEEYQDHNFFDVKSMFHNLTEENSPIHNFQNYFIKEMGFEPDEAIRVYLTKETADELKKQIEYWVRVFHGGYLSDYRVQKNVDWLWFNNGPSEFQETPDWAEEGRIYKRKRV